jgi:hypothetical protein
MSEALFHVTSTKAVANISKEGMRPISYWSNDESLVAYYKETVVDDGDEPVVLVIAIDQLLQSVGEMAIEPDYPGIEEPITGAIGKSEMDVLSEWRLSHQGWRDSLEVVGSLRCRVAIGAELLKMQNEKSGTLDHLIVQTTNNPRMRV